MWHYLDASSSVWQQTQTDQRANEIFVRVKKTAEGSCPMMYPMTRLTFNHRWKELLWQVLAFTHPPSNLICCQTCNTVSRHQRWGSLSTLQTSVMNVKAMNSWRLGGKEGRGGRGMKEKMPPLLFSVHPSSICLGHIHRYFSGPKKPSEDVVRVVVVDVKNTAWKLGAEGWKQNRHWSTNGMKQKMPPRTAT